MFEDDEFVQAQADVADREMALSEAISKVLPDLAEHKMAPKKFLAKPLKQPSCPWPTAALRHLRQITRYPSVIEAQDALTYAEGRLKDLLRQLHAKFLHAVKGEVSSTTHPPHSVAVVAAELSSPLELSSAPSCSVELADPEFAQKQLQPSAPVTGTLFDSIGGGAHWPSLAGPATFVQKSSALQSVWSALPDTTTIVGAGLPPDPPCPHCTLRARSIGVGAGAAIALVCVQPSIASKVQLLVVDPQAPPLACFRRVGRWGTQARVVLEGRGRLVLSSP